MNENFNRMNQDIDPDENYFDNLFPFINSTEQSKYVTLSEFNSFNNPSSKFLTILSFNIRSFNANSNLFFAQFDQFFLPEVLIFSETWFTEDNIQEIPGYNSYHTLRVGSRSGGVSVYIKDCYLSSKIETLCVSNSIIELCSVDVVIGGVNWCLLGIYRPHSETPETFTSFLEEILQSVTLRNKNCIVLGDININLLLNNSVVDAFTASMRSYHYIPIITKPTRFSPDDSCVPSLIDHIWTNKPNIYYSGVILSDVSDHCPTFICLKVNNDASDSETVKSNYSA